MVGSSHIKYRYEVKGMSGVGGRGTLMSVKKGCFSVRMVSTRSATRQALVSSQRRRASAMSPFMPSTNRFGMSQSLLDSSSSSIPPVPALTLPEVVSRSSRGAKECARRITWNTLPVCGRNKS